MSYYFVFLNKTNAKTETKRGLILSLSIIMPDTYDQHKYFGETIGRNVRQFRTQGYECYCFIDDEEDVLGLLELIDIQFQINDFKKKREKLTLGIRAVLNEIMEYRETLDSLMKTCNSEIEGLLKIGEDYEGETLANHDIGNSIHLFKVKYNSSTFTGNKDNLLKSILLLKKKKEFSELLSVDNSKKTLKEICDLLLGITGIYIMELLTPEAIKREREEIERDPTYMRQRSTTEVRARSFGPARPPDAWLVPASRSASGARSQGAAEEPAKGAFGLPFVPASALGPAGEESITIDEFSFADDGVDESELIKLLSKSFSVEDIARKLKDEKPVEYEDLGFALTIVKSIIDTQNAVAPPKIIYLSVLNESLGRIRRDDRVLSPLTIKGSINLGSTCYLNAVLQLLYRGLFWDIIKLSKFDIYLGDGIGLTKGEKKISDYIQALQFAFVLLYDGELQAELATEEKKPFINLNIIVVNKDGTFLFDQRTLFDVLLFSFERGQQDDNEYLSAIFSGMNDGIESVKNVARKFTFNNHKIIKYRDTMHDETHPETLFRLYVSDFRLSTGKKSVKLTDLITHTLRERRLHDQYDKIPEKILKYGTYDDTGTYEESIDTDTHDDNILFIHIQRSISVKSGEDVVEGKDKFPVIPDYNLRLPDGTEWELVCATVHVGEDGLGGHYFMVQFELDPKTSALKIIYAINDEAVITPGNPDGYLGDNPRIHYDMDYISQNCSSILYRKKERPRAVWGGFNKYMKYKLKYLKLKKMLANQ